MLNISISKEEVSRTFKRFSEAFMTLKNVWVTAIDIIFFSVFYSLG